MSIETKVKIINSDPFSLYKTQKIRFSSSLSFTTPSKAIDLDKLGLEQKLNKDAKRFNEIFKRFNAEQIKRIDEENELFDRLQNWFNRQKKKAEPETPTVTIVEFDEDRFPSKEEIEFLIGAIYPNSDIVTIPIVPGINKKKKSELDFDGYKKYVKEAIEDIEGLNNKPIMGTIPKLPGTLIKDLINFYVGFGINSFLVDFDGSNPVSYDMRTHRILRALKENKLLETSYLFGHNVGLGRPNKDVLAVPARDILGFGLGLNSLGNKHKKFVPNRTFFEFIKMNPEKKFRLFDKGSYSYWNYEAVSKSPEAYPKDSSISWDELKKSKMPNKLQKTFNEEQIALETNKIYSVINEDSEKSLSYLKSKKFVEKDDFKKIENSTKRIN
ncbi:hypothetical protein KKG83_02555 [Candidatus Micrarchaeota archaeon]|nr:hypothetical protein [Candidatus Micrarchaeota archaeon]MBU2476330.1 hypothetical protein [Candidatus Micrarchaeota archaeon]